MMQDGSTLAHVAVEGQLPVDTMKTLIEKKPSIISQPDFVSRTAFGTLLHDASSLHLASQSG